jgi:hypothetical protein
MKATRASEVRVFTDIPNVGPAISADFKVLNINTPAELKKQDPFNLYQKLCRTTGTRHDPCVLDTFMAAVDFMNGAPAKPWWHYTSLRKKRFSKL